MALPAPNDEIARQVQDVVQEGYDLFVTNAVGVMGFTVLVWDHIITFEDELEMIWKRRNNGGHGLLKYLFIVLRYLAPLGFAVQLCSYMFSPDVWTPEICARYVVFEGCMTVSALGIVALMMLLRVYALWGRSLKILLGVGALFVFQFAVQGWLLGHSMPVPRSPYIKPAGCSMLFTPDVGTWAPASAYFPIIYDSVVFGLTLYKTIHVMRNRRNKPVQGDWIMHALLRDGALYYFVMLVTNIPLVIMIATAPPGIRNIAAQWEFLITVTIMCRITLSLRREDAAWSIGTQGTQFAQSTLYFDDPQRPDKPRVQRQIRTLDVDSEAGKRRSVTTGKRQNSSLPRTPNLDDADLDHEAMELEIDITPWRTINSDSTVVSLHVPGRGHTPVGGRLSNGSIDLGRPTATHIDFPTSIAEEPPSPPDYFNMRVRRRPTDEESDIGSATLGVSFRPFSQTSLREVSVEDAPSSVDTRKYDSFPTQ